MVAGSALANLLRRSTSGKGSDIPLDYLTVLQSDLAYVINSGVIDIPQELRDPIVVGSHSEEGRKLIMKNLQECLAEPKAKSWKRIYAGLVLAEDLLAGGAEDLFIETGAGMHFDIVQRLAFLEHFKLPEKDQKLQQMLRSKALAVRLQMVPRIQMAEIPADGLERTLPSKQEPQEDCGASAVMETASLRSSATEVSTATPGSHSSSTSWLHTRAKTGKAVVNGMVRVGHNDDTTSGSESEEAERRSSGRTKVNRRSKRERDAEAAPASPSCQADLVTPSSPMTSVAPASPATSVSLIDL